MKQNTEIVSASLAYFQHANKYVNEAETILKVIQCFISVLFQDVRTSKIKLQFKQSRPICKEQSSSVLRLISGHGHRPGYCRSVMELAVGIGWRGG